MQIDTEILEHRLEALRGFDRWPADGLTRFARALESADAWGLFRINPLLFAEREGFDPEVTVDLFVRGVKVGLFELVWSCVCIFCGALEYTYDSIDHVPRRDFRCTRCDIEIDSWLDERVEVSFSIHPSVAALGLDPFADLGSYLRYHTAPSVVHGAQNAALLVSIVQAYACLAEDGDGELPIELAPGASLRLASLDRHARLILLADPEPAREASVVDVDLLATGFPSRTLRVPAGELRLRLSNRSPRRAGVLVLDGDVEGFREHVETERASFGRLFSGHMLLCTESFRRLFRIQSLDEELALNVRHVTLLFTDLVASTDLYERVGDVAAYGLVRGHFRELYAATEACGGAVVKTMGDAIMAAFCSAADAIRAALDMLARITRLNAGSSRALGLRVGVHGSSAIVVHAEGRLDYFGQGVNLAARIQTLAEAGTLCLSTELMTAPGVAKLLEGDTRVDAPEFVSVRGVSEPISICRVTPLA